MVKERFKKAYRHPTLDARLTAQRLRQEVRSMLRARKLGVTTPVLYHVDATTASIYMQKVEGQSLKATLQAGGATANPLPFVELVKALGVEVAHLHDGGIVHGDLTTSNVLVRSELPLVIIDFGLSSFSIQSEDRAVDLYVLERAFSSAHPALGAQLFEEFLQAYRRNSRNWCSTLNRFADVRMRGRKRSMVG